MPVLVPVLVPVPFFALLVALATAAFWPVGAQASQALAQKNNCTGCHAAERKLVGPAFHEIAKKYADDKEAAAKLAASIRAGGAGKWGPVPMPPQVQLSEAEAQLLAQWVLGGGK